MEKEKEKTYTIFRHYDNGTREDLETDVTLEEAQAHCSDPETSYCDPDGDGSWADRFRCDNLSEEEIAEREERDIRLAKTIAKARKLGI